MAKNNYEAAPADWTSKTVVPLHPGGPFVLERGTLPPDGNVADNERMSNTPTREEFQARIAAAEAQADARFMAFDKRISEAMSEVRGEIKAIHGEIGNLKNIKANVWAATAVIVGTIFAAASLGFGAFDSGRETAKLNAETQRTVEAALAEIRKATADFREERKAPLAAPPQ